MTSSLLTTQCSAQSVGTFNAMVSTLLQALVTAQCAISPPELWPPDYAEQALKHGLKKYDFVIVGAGSAGSVIASRLSENPNWKVLVLESGGDPPQESEIALFPYTLQHTRASWNHTTEYSAKACLGWVGSRCYWPRGKMIGGSGGINGMAWVRGNRRDYDEWAQAGNKGWSWNDLLPYFERAIRPVGNETQPQGYMVINSMPIGEVNYEQMILKGAAELGFPTVLEFNEGRDIGYAKMPTTYQDGRRMSSGKTYLAKVAQRPNLHVIKNADVTKLNFDKSGKNVKSVSFVVQEKHKMNVKIRKEVVLSAGAIGSPKLLMLSGVGPKKQLKKLHIPLVHDLPVGENLQDHLMVITFLKLNENAAPALTTFDALDNTYSYLIHGNGPLSMFGTFPITGFINTLNNSPYPDLQFHHFSYRRGDFDSLKVFLDGPSIAEEFKTQMLKAIEVADVLVIFNILLNPKSVGNIRLQTANYKDYPTITHNYLSEPEDEATLLRALRYQEQLLTTAAYKALNATLVLPTIDECDVKKMRSDDYWRCYIKYFTATLYHPTGTVKMAPAKNKTSCVNPRLLLNGCDNLRVADASITPKIPSGNTNAPTVMIAEKAVDLIREDWQD